MSQIMNNPLETHHIYIQQTQNVNILNGKHVLRANEIETHDTNVDADVSLRFYSWTLYIGDKGITLNLENNYSRQVNFRKFLFTWSMVN